MKNNDIWYKLYSNCIITKGFTKSVLIDLQFSRLFEVPSEICTILNNLDSGNTLNFELKHFNETEKVEIFKYLNWLEGNHYLFKTDCKKEFQRFSNLNKDYDFPFRISNCIICISEFCADKIERILTQVNKIIIPYLEIRIETEVNLDLLNKLSHNVHLSTIEEIDLYISNTKLKASVIEEFCLRNIRFRNIYIYNSKHKKKINMHGNQTTISFLKMNYKGAIMCGNIASTKFPINILSFMESLSFNNCLNRKLTIDAEGNIKNCPSMKQSFGNIKDTTLEEAINKRGFKKYWNIHKDKIKVCQDCEFRYICTDCRAYTEDPKDIYSKPLKCGYNPYTGEWSEWSTNPLKQKAIKFYGMEDLIVEPTDNSKDD